MSNEWIEWNGGECPVPKGTLVDVKFKGGTEIGIPALEFSGISHAYSAQIWSAIDPAEPGKIEAYRLHKAQPEESPMTIEQLLAKANHHATKAAKHERKRDELIQQARELVPEGWELKECGLVKQPEEDMTNPENWKAGDVVECVRQHPELTAGRDYQLLVTYAGDAYDGDGDVRVLDDGGDKTHYDASFFRWLRRPSAQGEE